MVAIKALTISQKTRCRPWITASNRLPWPALVATHRSSTGSEWPC